MHLLIIHSPVEEMNMSTRQVPFVVTALLITALTMLLIARLMEERGGVLVADLATLEDRGIIYVEDLKAFLVAGRPTPIALSAIDPHLGHVDTFCRSSQMFEGKHGEKYDRFGFYFGGPAPRGLDRIRVRVDRDDVYVYPGDRSPGPPRYSDTKDPVGPFCS